MKHEKRLEAGERWDIPAFGQYLGYVSGAGEIEVSIDGELHYLGVNEVYESFDGFKSVCVRNVSDVAGNFVIKSGMGKLYMAGDGQVIDVLGIRSTVSTEVLNADDVSAPIVSKIAELMSSVINIRAITETLQTHVLNTVDIRQITETLTANVVNTVTAQIANTVNTNITNAIEITGPLEAVIANGHGSLWQQLSTIQGQIDGISSQIDAPAISISTSQKAFTAGESFTVPANTNRRDITIFAAETNTDVVTVAGIPLAAGQYVELKNYVGSIGATAAAADSITIVEVIK